MDRVIIDGKEWYNIKDFMEKYEIGSNATVYAMTKDGRAEISDFMGKRIFSKKVK